jgi:hypothetical protein
MGARPDGTATPPPPSLPAFSYHRHGVARNTVATHRTVGRPGSPLLVDVVAGPFLVW